MLLVKTVRKQITYVIRSTAVFLSLPLSRPFCLELAMVTTFYPAEVDNSFPENKIRRKNGLAVISELVIPVLELKRPHP